MKRTVITHHIQLSLVDQENPAQRLDRIAATARTGVVVAEPVVVAVVAAEAGFSSPASVRTSTSICCCGCLSARGRVTRTGGAAAAEASTCSDATADERVSKATFCLSCAISSFFARICEIVSLRMFKHRCNKPSDQTAYYHFQGLSLFRSNVDALVESVATPALK